MKNIAARAYVLNGLASIDPVVTCNCGGVHSCSKVTCGMHHAHTCLGRRRMGMSDGRNRSDFIVGRICKRQRDGAHERPVAVVAFSRKPMSEPQCRSRGIPDIEEAVACICILSVPGNKLCSHIIGIDISKLTVAVADSKRH